MTLLTGRVLDLTGAEGLLCGKILADLGAEVIKVERPGGDPSRNNGPFYHNIPQPEKSLYWFAYNLNKKGITLDIEKSDGREIFKRLVEGADFVIESFPPGYMDGLGLGYNDLSVINPAIVVTSITPFGQYGPYRDYKSSDITLLAMGGLLYITGYPDRPPVPPSTYYTDQLSPMYATLSIMAALDYRRRTGRGQYIDHAQIEAGLNYMTPLILDYQANGRELALNGNKCDFAAPHGIYKCKGEDRWVAIAVMTDGEWRDFVKAIGSPEWAKLKKYATAAGRVKNSGELDRRVEEWTINRTPEQVQETLQKAGVGAGLVADARDLDEDPQMSHYNFYRELDHPYMGKLRYYHPDPIKLSDAEPDITRPVLVGEHTDFVCTDILGMSQDEIDELRGKGVFD